MAGWVLALVTQDGGRFCHRRARPGGAELRTGTRPTTDLAAATYQRRCQLRSTAWLR